MTTPPLDLPALRAEIARDEPFASIGVATIVALIDQAEAAMDGEHVADSLATMLTKDLRAAEARAEAAEKAVAAVREALEAHPKACDRHTEDDPIKCGWKRAVADVTRALDSTPYRTLSTEPLVSTHHTPETETP